MLKKARNDQKILHWALALVAGGAVGNLIDRIYYGVVTDFVLWHYKSHEWPVFNVADIVLVVGVGLMFIDIQKEGKREKAKSKPRGTRRQRPAGLVKDLAGIAAPPASGPSAHAHASSLGDLRRVSRSSRRRLDQGSKAWARTLPTPAHCDNAG